MSARPWRKVTGKPDLHAGRGSVLGKDTARRSRWWDLPLECGHVEQRTVRYKALGPAAQRGGTQRRRAADVLPAPGRVRCGQCPEA
jgi:hypothetical protein